MRSRSPPLVGCVKGCTQRRRRAFADLFDFNTVPLFLRPHRQSSNDRDTALRWEESRVDAAYVASNGPCQIAVAGKQWGRSIAVAASRGLCVLDLSRMPRPDLRHAGPAPAPRSMLSWSPRWKVFGNVKDERRFSVVRMLWFERSLDDSEDLLLAVVQYTALDTPHLACWSRKR